MDTCIIKKIVKVLYFVFRSVRIIYGVSFICFKCIFINFFKLSPASRLKMFYILKYFGNYFEITLNKIIYKMILLTPMIMPRIWYR